MKSLFQLGYYLKGVAPNTTGRMLFEVIEIATGEKIAETDTPATADEIMPIAIQFANEHLNGKDGE